MCDIELDRCQVWRDTTRKARKHHICDCCRGAIKPGETYTDHFSLFDGSPESSKECAACTAMAEEFRKEHGTRGTPSYMPHLLRECIGEDDYLSNEDEKWQAALDEMKARQDARLLLQLRRPIVEGP